jgi:hypothetical protein
LLLAALLTGFLAETANAYRKSTPTERRAIVAAIDLFQLKQDCASTRTCKPRVSDIRISLADQSFAMAGVWVPNVGGAQVLLHKVYGTWRVKDIGSSDVGCGKAPKAVRVDLEITCGGK